MALGPFTFAELARVAGVPLWDAQLPPRQPPCSAGAVFHDEHVKRLCFIKNALSYGFTLEDIAQLAIRALSHPAPTSTASTPRRLEATIQADASDISRIVALDTLLTSCLGTGSREDCQILATLATSIA
jgi:DNA-binding transcriptional MerR regulator